MKTIFVMICLCVATLTQAQLYNTSIGWNNTYLFNPALTGENSSSISINHSARSPRFSGSPYLTTFNAESPTGKTLGVGFTVNHYSIGPLQSLGFRFKASRKVKLKTGYLRVGGAGEVVTKTLSSDYSNIWPNAQVGVSYHTLKLTLGMAYQNYYEPLTPTESYNSSNENNLLSAHASYKINLTSTVSITPQTTVFHRSNSKLLYQFRALASYKEKFRIGLGTQATTKKDNYIELQAFTELSITSRLFLNYALGTNVKSNLKSHIHSVGLILNLGQS
ncbi:MAG: type IX secretion system membrane protein PorP/SprF [Flavobacteriales bacterium]